MHLSNLFLSKHSLIIWMTCFIQMAPEVIRRDSYGIPADVYSFGMFLFCIICAKQYPFADLYLTPTHAAIGVVKNQLRPKLNSRVPNTVSQIITMCWATDAASRPTMEIVIAMLLNALHVERRKQREKDEAETDNQPSHSNWWTWGSSSQKKSSSNSTSTDTKQTNAQSDNDEENIEPGSKPVSATSSLPSNLSQNGDN